MLTVCVAGVMVMELLAVAIVRLLANQFLVAHRQVKAVDALKAMSPAGGRPLTIRSANELLARAPSVKSALDELAFHGRRNQLPCGTQSALAVLGKEDFKL